MSRLKNVSPTLTDPKTQRPPFDEDRMTRSQAAAYIGLSPATLATDATRKQLGIPFYRLGNRVFYRKSDLDVWLETRRVENPWQ